MKYLQLYNEHEKRKFKSFQKEKQADRDKKEEEERKKSWGSYTNASNYNGGRSSYNYSNSYRSAVWSTKEGGFWSDSKTWEDGIIPGSESKVLINGPVILDNAEPIVDCYNLSIIYGKSLIISSGVVLTVSNDFYNYGTLELQDGDSTSKTSLFVGNSVKYGEDSHVKDGLNTIIKLDKKSPSSTTYTDKVKEELPKLDFLIKRLFPNVKEEDLPTLAICIVKDKSDLSYNKEYMITDIERDSITVINDLDLEHLYSKKLFRLFIKYNFDVCVFPKSGYGDTVDNKGKKIFGQGYGMTKNKPYKIIGEAAFTEYERWEIIDDNGFRVSYPKKIFTPPIKFNYDTLSFSKGKSVNENISVGSINEIQRKFKSFQKEKQIERDKKEEEERRKTYSYSSPTNYYKPSQSMTKKSKWSTKKGGNWSNPKTWEDGVVPSYKDDILIYGDVILDLGLKYLSCKNLTIGFNASLTISSGVILNSFGDVRVYGDLVLQDGTKNIATTLIVSGKLERGLTQATIEIGKNAVIRNSKGVQNWGDKEIVDKNNTDFIIAVCLVTNRVDCFINKEYDVLEIGDNSIEIFNNNQDVKSYPKYWFRLYKKLDTNLYVYPRPIYADVYDKNGNLITENGYSLTLNKTYKILGESVPGDFERYEIVNDREQRVGYSKGLFNTPFKLSESVQYLKEGQRKFKSFQPEKQAEIDKKEEEERKKSYKPTYGRNNYRDRGRNKPQRQIDRERINQPITPSRPPSKKIINSTKAGGEWRLPSTWIGGSVPTGIDNVIIIGDVILDNSNYYKTCSNLFIYEHGSLIISSCVVLSVDGDFTNRGYVALEDGDNIDDKFSYTGLIVKGKALTAAGAKMDRGRYTIFKTKNSVYTNKDESNSVIPNIKKDKPKSVETKVVVEPESQKDKPISDIIDAHVDKIKLLFPGFDLSFLKNKVNCVANTRMLPISSGLTSGKDYTVIFNTHMDFLQVVNDNGYKKEYKKSWFRIWKKYDFYAWAMPQEKYCTGEFKLIRKPYFLLGESVSNQDISKPINNYEIIDDSGTRRCYPKYWFSLPFKVERRDK
jgi:hypothetical protein